MQSKQLGVSMSLREIFESHDFTNPTTAEKIAEYLDDATTVEDIRHRHYKGGAAFGDMLDAAETVIDTDQRYALVGLFTVRRRLGELETGTVVMLHQDAVASDGEPYATYVLTTDAHHESVTFQMPAQSGYIADSRIAAEGILRLHTAGGSIDTQHLGEVPMYPHNHAA